MFGGSDNDSDDVNVPPSKKEEKIDDVKLDTKEDFVSFAAKVAEKVSKKVLISP